MKTENKKENQIPNFFEWCADYAETFGCSIETAYREYHYQFYPETYNPEDYDCDIYDNAT